MISVMGAGNRLFIIALAVEFCVEVANASLALQGSQKQALLPLMAALLNTVGAASSSSLPSSSSQSSYSAAGDGELERSEYSIPSTRMINIHSDTVNINQFLSKSPLTDTRSRPKQTSDTHVTSRPSDDLLKDSNNIAVGEETLLKAAIKQEQLEDNTPTASAPKDPNDDNNNEELVCSNVNLTESERRSCKQKTLGTTPSNIAKAKRLELMLLLSNDKGHQKKSEFEEDHVVPESYVDWSALLNDPFPPLSIKHLQRIVQEKLLPMYRESTPLQQMLAEVALHSKLFSDADSLSEKTATLGGHAVSQNLISQDFSVAGQYLILPSPSLEDDLDLTTINGKGPDSNTFRKHLTAINVLWKDLQRMGSALWAPYIVHEPSDSESSKAMQDYLALLNKGEDYGEIKSNNIFTEDSIADASNPNWVPVDDYEADRLAETMGLGKTAKEMSQGRVHGLPKRQTTVDLDRLFDNTTALFRCVSGFLDDCKSIRGQPLAPDVSQALQFADNFATVPREGNGVQFAENSAPVPRGKTNVQFANFHGEQSSRDDSERLPSTGTLLHGRHIPTFSAFRGTIHLPGRTNRADSLTQSARRLQEASIPMVASRKKRTTRFSLPATETDELASYAKRSVPAEYPQVSPGFNNNGIDSQPASDSAVVQKNTRHKCSAKDPHSRLFRRSSRNGRRQNNRFSKTRQQRQRRNQSQKLLNWDAASERTKLRKRRRFLHKYNLNPFQTPPTPNRPYQNWTRDGRDDQTSIGAASQPGREILNRYKELSAGRPTRGGIQNGHSAYDTRERWIHKQMQSKNQRLERMDSQSRLKRGFITPWSLVTDAPTCSSARNEVFYNSLIPRTRYCSCTTTRTSLNVTCSTDGEVDADEDVWRWGLNNIFANYPVIRFTKTYYCANGQSPCVPKTDCACHFRRLRFRLNETNRDMSGRCKLHPRCDPTTVNIYATVAQRDSCQCSRSRRRG